jgi:hypothetical protein
MVAFPAEILLGIYLGLLIGIIPALCAWALGFGFRYSTGSRVAQWAVLVLALSVAAGNGAVLLLTDQAILADPAVPRIGTAVLVVGMLALYAQTKGDEMAVDFPQRLSLSQLREQTLDEDTAEFVNGGTEVRVRVVGEVADMEGHPPLPEELRAKLRTAELTLPADLRLSELEGRFEDRLGAEYDLGDISVSIDERGRATVVAAPPFSGLSKRVDHDRHAVSVRGLIPTGLARGDEVTVITPNAQVRGTVVSASSEVASEEDEPEIAPLATDEPVDGDETKSPVRTPTTEGGEGRLTVAVTRTDVQPLLRASEAKIVVEPRGTRREYEVVSMLRRADKQFRRFVVGSNSPLSGTRLGSAALDERFDVAVLAVQTEVGWQVAPDSDTTIQAGDELFAVGERNALDEFETSGIQGGGRIL